MQPENASFALKKRRLSWGFVDMTCVDILDMKYRGIEIKHPHIQPARGILRDATSWSKNQALVKFSVQSTNATKFTSGNNRRRDPACTFANQSQRSCLFYQAAADSVGEENLESDAECAISDQSLFKPRNLFSYSTQHPISGQHDKCHRCDGSTSRHIQSMGPRQGRCPCDVDTAKIYREFLRGLSEIDPPPSAVPKLSRSSSLHRRRTKTKKRCTGDGRPSATSEEEWFYNDDDDPSPSACIPTRAGCYSVSKLSNLFRNCRFSALSSLFRPLCAVYRGRTGRV
jgi:hypothetical protein